MFRDFNANTIDTSDIQGGMDQGSFSPPRLTNPRLVLWSRDLSWQSQASVQVTSSHTGLCVSKLPWSRLCLPGRSHSGPITGQSSGQVICLDQSERRRPGAVSGPPVETSPGQSGTRPGPEKRNLSRYAESGDPVNVMCRK